jgi:hypothetical protein
MIPVLHRLDARDRALFVRWAIHATTGQIIALSTGWAVLAW